MGDAVNVAARMEQTAEPGPSRSPSDTYRLVADLFEVEPLGGVELKGKRRPVESYRVLGRLDAPWTVRAARRMDAPLVGREKEIAAIRAAFDRAHEGRGSVLLLVGDPGIGKSRLIEETDAIWAVAEPEDDRRWDFWGCVPFDTMQPYAQYRRLMKERADVKESDPAETVRDKIADLMEAIALEGWEERSEQVARALLGVEREDETPSGGRGVPRRGHRARRGLDAGAGRSPADRLRGPPLVRPCLARAGPSDHRARRGESRSWSSPRSAPIATAFSWEFKEWVEPELAAHATVLELDPLSAEQSDESDRGLLAVPEMTGAERQRILRKTEGNPLFVQEVARALIDGGVVERGEEGGG